MTEVSSLFSIDTARASNPPPGFPSHTRERGSITSIVHVHPTIREEASQTTIRGPHASHDDEEARAAWELVQDLHARKWGDLGDVAQSLLTRSPYGPTQPPVPHSRAEIEAILAESVATYKPLGDKLGRVHRRKSSLNSTRSAVAPYGLQPAPLETRFQSRRASGETVSPLLAEFARDVVPLPRPEVKAPDTKPVSDVRTGVPSDVRRDNLGWGRRRYSDEPAPSLPTVVLGKKPMSATQASFPSFLAFSPAPASNPSQLGHTHQKHTSKPVMSSLPGPPRAAKPVAKPVTKPRVQKRIHVKTDSKGSPVSVHNLPTRNLSPRPDSAPLGTRSGNVANSRRVHKTKSSPEARRTKKADKENVRAPLFVLPAPRARV